MAESQKGGTRVAFVDFIYAIVVGTAFALVPPVDLSVRFLVCFFSSLSYLKISISITRRLQFMQTRVSRPFRAGVRNLHLACMVSCSHVVS